MTSLAVSRGVTYAGTTGGLLAWSGKGVKHYTREDGLPGLRIRHVQAVSSGLQVRAEQSSLLRDGAFSDIADWLPSRLTPPKEVSRALGHVAFKGKTWWIVPLRGLVHLQRGSLIDFQPRLPSRLATCAVVDQTGSLVVGTADQGAYRLTGSSWKQLPLPQRSLPREAVSLVPVKTRLWIAPRHGRALGLHKRTATGTQQPWRQSVLWNGKTVVRRADGRLVEVTEEGTERPLNLKLPRTTATAIFVEKNSLFVAQQGGWSEFVTGRQPIHRFDVEPLRSRPTTSILVTKDHVLVGTQNNGLVRVERSTGTVSHFHEAHGLRDDWITALEVDESGNPLVGTYVGGLHALRGDRCEVVGLPDGFVTRLFRRGQQVWVGSLSGVRLWSGGSLTEPNWNRWIEPDVTDLTTIGDDLWIAAGGALFRRKLP